jgi:hypothetical protein
MAKLQIKAGSTSETIDIFVQDSSATDGSGLAGLVFNTASLTCYYNFRRGSSTSVTLATLAAANSAWSSGGFKEIDATNQIGKYRFDIPDALLASGNGRYVTITFQGAADMAPVLVEIELTGPDNQLVPGAVGAQVTCDANNSVKIQSQIKKNTALNNHEITMFDSAGVFATGLTVALTRSIDGAAPAACTNSPMTEVTSGAGRYKINLSAADLNGNVISFQASASGARDLSWTWYPVP